MKNFSFIGLVSLIMFLMIPIMRAGPIDIDIGKETGLFSTLIDSQALADFQIEDSQNVVLSKENEQSDHPSGIVRQEDPLYLKAERTKQEFRYIQTFLKPPLRCLSLPPPILRE